MPNYPRWLLPNGSDICALIRMSCGLNARTRTHSPMADSARREAPSPEYMRKLAVNAAKARAARRAQQIALLEFDDRLGR